MEKVVILWNLICVFICTAILLFCIDKKKGKSLDFRLSMLVLIVISGFFGGMALIIKNEMLSSRLQVVFEIICWIIIASLTLRNKWINKKNIKVKKKEISIFAIVMLMGILLISVLAITNYKYISPSNKEGYIGNYYFNADVYRGIEDATTLKGQHMIHPAYRFILMPIIFPIIIFTEIATFLKLDAYTIHLISGYFICFVQIILNSISAVLFYKIMKKENIEEKIAMFRNGII